MGFNCSFLKSVYLFCFVHVFRLPIQTSSAFNSKDKFGCNFLLPDWAKSNFNRRQVLSRPCSFITLKQSLRALVFSTPLKLFLLWILFLNAHAFFFFTYCSKGKKLQFIEVEANGILEITVTSIFAWTLLKAKAACYTLAGTLRELLGPAFEKDPFSVHHAEHCPILYKIHWKTGYSIFVRAADTNTNQLYLQTPSLQKVCTPCHTKGDLAEDFGNSALLPSNTIPSHIKYTTSGRAAYLPELKTSSANVSAGSIWQHKCPYTMSALETEVQRRGIQFIQNSFFFEENTCAP